MTEVVKSDTTEVTKNETDTSVTKSESTNAVDAADSQKSETNWGRIVMVGILVALVICLLWYGYCKFVSNQKIKEKMTKDAEGERDDPVVDFNLRESIMELEDMQKRILSGLSDNLGI